MQLPVHRYLRFFLVYAAWVRSRAERPSVSYTKVVSNVDPSRYLRTTLPNILGWKCSVSPLSAIGLHNSFRLKALASSVFVKTTLERCGPFSLVVLSQRRSQVTSLSGHSDQNASETFSNKLQLNKVQSSLRQTSAKTTQVRSKAKTS